MKKIILLIVLIASLFSCKKDESVAYSYRVNGYCPPNYGPMRFDVSYIDKDGNEVTLTNVEAGTVYEFKAPPAYKRISAMNRCGGSCTVEILRGIYVISRGWVGQDEFGEWATATF